MLEQWANVVGRERATAELEAALKSYTDLNGAASALGFSTYALKKFRRSFAEMPAVTPQAPPASTFEEFLRRLPELRGEPEISFTIHVVPRLAAFLGYAESETYFEAAIGGDYRRRMDAVFAPAGISRPHIVLELKRAMLDRQVFERAVEQTEQYRAAAGAPIGLVLSSEELAILTSNGRTAYALSKLTSSQVGDIHAILRRPSKVKAAAPQPAPAGTLLRELLEKVADAKTNDEKKSTLETLAANVFDGQEFIRCKYRNLRTRSSELDIVCEVVGAEHQCPLREYGRYFFVECKNWSVPAGAKEIRDFLGKLRKSRVRLGIYFSRNGITGEKHGTDALREIHSAFDQDGTCVVVISEQDLSALQHAQDVLGVVEAKLDALRFDF